MLVIRVDPRAGHHPCAITGTDFVFETIDQSVERGGIDDPFFDQKGFERLNPKGRIRRHCLMLVILILILLADVTEFNKRAAAAV